MVRDDWVVGGARRSAAAERIYASATELVIRDGLDAFDIDTLAARVHCSRATVYRYAGGKSQIRDAVLMRLATGIVDTVRRAVNGLEGIDRVVAAIAVTLEQVRSNPLRRLLLSSANAPELGELQANPMLQQLALELTGIGDDDPEAARWIVHVVVSLAHWPISDEHAESLMIRRFVAPAFNT